MECLQERYGWGLVCEMWDIVGAWEMWQSKQKHGSMQTANTVFVYDSDSVNVGGFSGRNSSQNVSSNCSALYADANVLNFFAKYFKLVLPSREC